MAEPDKVDTTSAFESPAASASKRSKGCTPHARARDRVLREGAESVKQGRDGIADSCRRTSYALKSYLDSETLARSADSG
jgi:hypothetical protein